MGAKKKKRPVRRAERERTALPDEPKEPSFKLNEYTMLVYGREKIGKTTLFASFPEAVFFTTEPGTKGMRIFEYNHEDGGCHNWSIIRDGVAELEANPGRFKTVIIDTVDRAYDMCLDWVCKDRGIEYPGEDSQGRQDFGRSWRAVKQEFMQTIHRIIQSGRGVCFTSHAHEAEIKTRSGLKFHRIVPSMSGQTRGVVEALVDLFFYAEYMSDRDGNDLRVLITIGDEVVWAGHRKCESPLPRFLPLLEEGGYDLIQAAFTGKDVGLDVSSLVPSKLTTDVGKKFVQAAKRQESED